MWLLWLLVKLEMFDKNCQHTTGYLSIVCTNVVIFSLHQFSCLFCILIHMCMFKLNRRYAPSNLVYSSRRLKPSWTMKTLDHDSILEGSWGLNTIVAISNRIFLKNFINCKLNRIWILRPFTLLPHLTTLLYLSAIVVIPQEIFPDNWHGRC